MQMRDLMNIIEGEDDDGIDTDITPSDERVAAISQLLIDKTEDSNVASKLNTDAFVNIINKMGMPMTTETLMDLVQSGDLSNIIADVNDKEVTFKGKGAVDTDAEMNVDKARQTVNTMAKRAAKKKRMK